MEKTLPVQDGRIPFRGYHTWYQIVGDREAEGKLPVLVLHGGPGATHDYLEPIGNLARTGRRVIFYDQLGAGKSLVPSNPSLWTIDLFKDEIDVVRRDLQLTDVHILGQSWGGMLGMEYALTQPPGLASLVVADSPASIPHWVAEANRLRRDLPSDVQETLLRHEQDGTTDSEEYAKASEVFYSRHVCRIDPQPDYVARSFAELEEHPEVYHTMNGPSEFHVIGTLKDWDITGRLDEIRVPTLIISGRYDEATPAIAQTVQDGIPNSEWVLFEHSSHMPHAEEPERFIEVVDGFLSGVEARR